MKHSYTPAERNSFLQNAIRLAANPSNLAHEVTFPPNYVDLIEHKPKAIISFGVRISPLLESVNITSNTQAWCVKQPELLLDLHSGKNLNLIHTY